MKNWRRLRYTVAWLSTGLLIVTLNIAFLQPNPAGVRLPANDVNATAKWSNLTQFKYSRSANRKGNSEIFIEAIDPRPGSIQPGVPFTLQAHISVVRDFPDLRVKWSLPEGMQLVAGNLKETLGHVTPDAPQDVSITVQQTSSENEQVHLSVHEFRGTVRYGAIHQFNTNFQEPTQAVVGQLKAMDRQTRGIIQ